MSCGGSFGSSCGGGYTSSCGGGYVSSCGGGIPSSYGCGGSYCGSRNYNNNDIKGIVSGCGGYTIGCGGSYEPSYEENEPIQTSNMDINEAAELVSELTGIPKYLAKTLILERQKNW